MEKQRKSIESANSLTPQALPKRRAGEEEAKNCSRCNTAFSFTTRRHYCRRCAKAFCSSCSSFTKRLPEFGVGTPVRVCETCFFTTNNAGAVDDTYLLHSRENNVQGLNALRREDKESAQELFNIAAKLDTQFMSPKLNQGLMKLETGDFDGAIEDFNQIIEIDATLKEVAYVYKGYAYFRKGDDRAAKEYLEVGIYLNPSYHVGYIFRGIIAYSKRRYQNCIKDLDIAAQLIKDNEIVHSNRGSAYFKLAEYDKAIKDFDVAITINSQNATSFANRGLARLFAGDYPKAQSDFSSALVLATPRPTPNLMSPRTLNSLRASKQPWRNSTAFTPRAGGLRDSVFALTSPLTLSSSLLPTQAPQEYVSYLYYYRATAWYKLGNYEKSIDDFNTGIFLNPHNEELKKHRELCAKKLGPMIKKQTPEVSRSLTPENSLTSPSTQSLASPPMSPQVASPSSSSQQLSGSIMKMRPPDVSSSTTMISSMFVTPFPPEATGDSVSPPMRHADLENSNFIVPPLRLPPAESSSPAAASASTSSNRLSPRKLITPTVPSTSNSLLLTPNTRASLRKRSEPTIVPLYPLTSSPPIKEPTPTILVAAPPKTATEEPTVSQAILKMPATLTTTSSTTPPKLASIAASPAPPKTSATSATTPSVLSKAASRKKLTTSAGSITTTVPLSSPKTATAAATVSQATPKTPATLTTTSSTTPPKLASIAAQTKALARSSTPKTITTGASSTYTSTLTPSKIGGVIPQTKSLVRSSTPMTVTSSPSTLPLKMGMAVPPVSRNRIIRSAYNVTPVEEKKPTEPPKEEVSSTTKSLATQQRDFSIKFFAL